MTYPQNGYPAQQQPQPQYQPPQQFQPPAPQQQPYAPPVNGYPAQQYPAQQGGYPMQQPPQQYGPPQGYGQQPQYGPPQGYGQPQMPQQVPVQVSLSDFYNQPTTGWGPSITPIGMTPDGTAYTMVVAQHITKAHVEHKTKYQSTELDYYRDGSPKIVMKVPGYVTPGTQYTTATGGVQPVVDGRAQLYVQGPDRDLLNAAMLRVGAAVENGPELGSIIRITKVHNKPNRSGTQSAVKTIEYWRPGAETAAFAQQSGIEYPDLSTPPPVTEAIQPPAPVQQPLAQPQFQAPPMPQQQFQAPPVPQQQAQPQFQAPQPPVPQQQFQPPAPPQPQQFQGPQQGAQPPAPQFDPSSLPPMDSAQQELMRTLIGQQQPQPTG